MNGGFGNRNDEELAAMGQRDRPDVLEVSKYAVRVDLATDITGETEERVSNKARGSSAKKGQGESYFVPP
jgi:hypothetical protein